MYRRTLLRSTAIVAVAAPAVALLDACSASQTSKLQADLNTGILDSGLITNALSTVEMDIKLDAPNAITPAQDAQFQKDIAALKQANANLTALGGTPLPSAAQPFLQQIITGFNDFAAVANAVLPAAAVAFPALGTVIITFQAATLIIQTVIEPLLTQIAANSAPAPAAPRAAQVRASVPARFAPPPNMTLEQARATLGLAAARKRSVR